MIHKHVTVAKYVPQEGQSFLASPPPSSAALFSAAAAASTSSVSSLI